MDKRKLAMGLGALGRIVEPTGFCPVNRTRLLGGLGTTSDFSIAFCSQALLIWSDREGIFNPLSCLS